MEVKVMKNVLAMNDEAAAENAALFQRKGIFVLNLMGSPGAGKTMLLERTLEALKDEMRLAVIEGDLFTSKDAERIDRLGVPVVQINTSGGCHLDAPMIKSALSSLDLDSLDMLIIENVGNLVCPAEFSSTKSTSCLTRTSIWRARRTTSGRFIRASRSWRSRAARARGFPHGSRGFGRMCVRRRRRLDE